MSRYQRVLAVYRETSRLAYQSILPDLPEVDALIVACIHRSGGATSDEVEVATGLKHQTVSAQIRHMCEGGILAPTDNRRPTRSGRLAIVWKLSDEAQPLR